MVDFSHHNKKELYNLYRLYRIQWSCFEVPNELKYVEKFKFAKPLRRQSDYDTWQELYDELEDELNRMLDHYDSTNEIIHDFIEDTYYNIFQKINVKV